MTAPNTTMRQSPTFTMHDAENLVAIHVGIKPTAIDRLPDTTPWLLEGDGFASWGELPGSDINDADTLHLVYYTDTVKDGIAAVRATWTDADLIPIYLAESEEDGRGAEAGPGPRICASNAADWSIELGDWDSLAEFDPNAAGRLTPGGNASGKHRYALHMGIAADDVAYLGGAQWQAAGDAWAAWGEPCVDGVLHVVVYGERYRDLIDAVRAALPESALHVWPGFEFRAVMTDGGDSSKVISRLRSLSSE